MLDTLPETRRQLLTTMKKSGELRVDQLADSLGITVSGVRQHLAALAGDGLVLHREVRVGPGRPYHLYRLSEDGDRLFPRTYGELTVELLEHVDAEDPGLVERVFERRRQRRVERAKARLADKGFADRVYELGRILDDDGYLAEVVELPAGGFRIVEHNCAILEVASRYGAACGTELEFIREVLPGYRVERVAHLLAGGHVCAYEVTEVARPVRRSPSTRTPRKPSPTS
jgi:DeoR family transcriptional regulator, suf operon transcriptional repressor